ncbi:MAG: hypothetical protein JRI80_10425 [Deltaproteobacteria bacterium]|nr:hypothetical protein [Deltaproteobacteria bacterium]
MRFEEIGEIERELFSWGKEVSSFVKRENPYFMGTEIIFGLEEDSDNSNDVRAESQGE